MPISPTLQTGLVVGRFGVGVADGPDIDDEPDVIPASGRITFTPMIPYQQNRDAAPAPATILRVPIITILDDDGYLCTPDPADPARAGARGVRLFATDDPAGSVTDWTYRVEYSFDRINGMVPAIPAHDMALPCGATRDLAEVAPVPSSQGYGLAQAEAAAAIAQAEAIEARQYAESILPGASAAMEAALQAAATAKGYRDQTEQEVVLDLEWSGAVSVAVDAPRFLHATLTGDVTLSLGTPGPERAFTVTLALTQDATGDRMVTIPEARAAWGVAYQHAGEAGSLDMVHLLWTGTYWAVFPAAQKVSTP